MSDSTIIARLKARGYTPTEIISLSKEYRDANPGKTLSEALWALYDRSAVDEMRIRAAAPALIAACEAAREHLWRKGDEQSSAYRQLTDALRAAKEGTANA